MAKLRVWFGGEKPITREGFYLNINGEDFGIEMDRVARITLPHDVVLFDGELEEDRLVNCPIGLFEIEKFKKRVHEQVRSKKKLDFIPDFFFFDATRYRGSRFKDILQDKFMQHIQQFVSPAEIERFTESLKQGEACGLCPVTERLVRRYLRITRSERSKRNNRR